MDVASPNYNHGSSLHSLVVVKLCFAKVKPKQSGCTEHGRFEKPTLVLDQGGSKDLDITIDTNHHSVNWDKTDTTSGDNGETGVG